MKLLRATVIVLAVLVPGAAFAVDDRCPIQALDAETIAKGIKDAPTCDASLKLFERCNFGSGADTEFGEIVTQKCEALFEGKLSPQQQRTYTRAIKVCNTKYARESGTMYRAFEASCRAQAAHRVAAPFSSLAQKPAPK